MTVMKKYLLSVIMGSFLLLLFGFQSTMSQDSKSSKIQITITEDDQVTTDTTFELAEGQDPEMIKKMISHMAGGDFHASHSGDKKMMDINMDSIKEAHPDAKVLVIKNKDGEITVKEVDDEHEMHFGDEGHGEHGEHHKMMIIGEGDVSEKHTVIIHSDVDCEGKGKNIEVIVHSGDDVKVIKKKVIVKTEDEDHVEVEVEVEIEEKKEGKKKKNKK